MDLGLSPSVPVWTECVINHVQQPTDDHALVLLYASQRMQFSLTVVGILSGNVQAYDLLKDYPSTYKR